jgi:hypothetical protein
MNKVSEQEFIGKEVAQKLTSIRRHAWVPGAIRGNPTETTTQVDGRKQSMYRDVGTESLCALLWECRPVQLIWSVLCLFLIMLNIYFLCDLTIVKTCLHRSPGQGSG